MNPMVLKKLLMLAFSTAAASTRGCFKKKTLRCITINITRQCQYRILIDSIKPPYSGLLYLKEIYP